MRRELANYASIQMPFIALARTLASGCDLGKKKPDLSIRL